MLTALANGRPDRLPCQVHAWMSYYLKHYLGGIDEWVAFERFGMDYAIYVSPSYVYDDKSLGNWIEKTTDLGVDEDGYRRELVEITTPKGVLCKKLAHTDVTTYETEYLFKNIQPGTKVYIV